MKLIYRLMLLIYKPMLINYRLILLIIYNVTYLYNSIIDDMLLIYESMLRVKLL